MASVPATEVCFVFAPQPAPRKFIVPEVRSEPVSAAPVGSTSPDQTLAPVAADETEQFTPDWAALLERLESSALPMASPSPVAPQPVWETVTDSAPLSTPESQYEIPAEAPVVAEPIVAVPEPPSVPVAELEPTPALAAGPPLTSEPMAVLLASAPTLPPLFVPQRTQRPRTVVRSIDALRPASGPSPVLEPLATTAPTSAGATGRSDIEDIVMAAPVEMWFGDSRIGVKAGTKTYAQFRKYADVLFGDLKAAKTRNR